MSRNEPTDVHYQRQQQNLKTSLLFAISCCSSCSFFASYFKIIIYILLLIYIALSFIWKKNIKKKYSFFLDFIYYKFQNPEISEVDPLPLLSFYLLYNTAFCSYSSSIFLLFLLFFFFLLFYLCAIFIRLSMQGKNPRERGNKESKIIDRIDGIDRIGT